MKESFEEQVSAAQQRLEALLNRTGDAEQKALLSEALEELSINLHELQVAAEELHSQNEELLEARQNVEAQRRRYQELFEFAPDGYFVTDARGTIREANQAAASLLNVMAEFLEGKPLVVFIAEEEHRLFNAMLMQLHETEKLSWEMRMAPRNGDAFFAELTAAGARDNEGKLVALRWLMRDVTERRNIEEALRQSERRFKSTFENAAVGMAHVGLDGRLLRVNDTFCRITGYPPDELVTKTFMEITHPDDLAADVAQAKELAEGRIPHYSMEKRYFRKDGSIVWVNLTGSVQHDDTGQPTHFIAVVEDISARKRIEEALRESEEKYHGLFDSAGDAVITIDREDMITSWNKSAERIFGWTAEEAVGKKLPDLTIPEDRIAERDGILRDALDSKNITGIDTIRLRKDGSRIDVSLTFSPIKNAEGKIIGLSGILRDITERKKLEEMRIENERLISADKARSEFLTLMSHELRTPLTSIIGYSILMKESHGRLKEKQEFYVDNILANSKHLQSLIDDILDLAKLEAGKLELFMEDVSLHEIIDGTLCLMKEKAAVRNIVLKNDFDRRLGTVKADRQKLQQILFNLLSNAVKFSKEKGGTVTVSTQKDGEMAKISVSDTGIGIKRKDIPRLFQKFQQLDSGIARKYEGTGLGLTITKQLVEMHGGDISVGSRYGRGSIFTFSIPIAGKSNTT